MRIHRAYVLKNGKERKKKVRNLLVYAYVCNMHGYVYQTSMIVEIHKQEML